jgi:hypothetical protein
MTDYSATDIRGWDAPSIVSYGQFIITGTHAVQYTIPLEYDLDATGGYQKDALTNKYLVKPYADTGSTHSTIGIPYRNLPAFTEDQDELPYIGLGSRRRDLGILHEGAHQIWYASGLGASRYGMRIAPDISGVRQQSVGMAFMGYCLDPGILPGSGFVNVRILSYDELTYAEVNEATVQGYIDTYVTEDFITGVLTTGYIQDIATGAVTDAYLQDTLSTGFITDLATGTITDAYLQTTLSTGYINDLATGVIDGTYISGYIDTYVTSGFISGVMGWSE